MNIPSTAPLRSSVRAVLDRSAIETHATGRPQVSDMINRLHAENSLVGIPATALAEAHGMTAADSHAEARLAALVRLPGTAVINLDGACARDVGALTYLARGDLARSHAAWLARRHTALLVTAEPGLAADLIDDEQLYSLSPDD